MHSDALLKLEQNPIDVFNETTRILIKIAENILKSPEDKKLRTLQLNNQTISNKVLNVSGAIECLQFMGFKQSKASLILPMNDSLKNLEFMQSELVKRKFDSNGVSIELAVDVEDIQLQTPSTNNNGSKKVKTENDDTFKRVVLPPLVHMFSNLFLKTMEIRFHKVLQCEDKDLQLRALHLLPQLQLEINAQNKLRSLQEGIKKKKENDDKETEIDIQDLMILELLNWFKYEFFEWVDSLDCENCGGKSENAGSSSSSELLVYADRVEVHKCTECGHLTHFGRFNDLNILLETRRGRCGEWANTFMLFCRALGWDTRFVYDEYDHVWTEVFSYGQNRWLHCDPCEAICDTPLVYETGWKKDVTYITAYSCDEVQDVTWRYTSQYANALKRRNSCSEMELVDGLLRMREVRQKQIGEARRKYLAKRCLAELVEMMVERHPSDKDSHGRISGSVAWKLSRNEIKNLEETSYVWSFSTDDLKAMKLTLKYSASSDKYELSTEKGRNIKQNWQSGIFATEGIFRKVEKDWNMVYISHREANSLGFVTWKFQITDTSYVFDEIDMKLGYKLFSNGRIYIKLVSAIKSITVEPSELLNHRRLFTGETWFTLTATLVGGLSWQHAQLFRQTIDDKDFPFSIQFSFKKK